MKKDLYNFAIRMGDTSWILSHRLCELCSYGPFLEEDLAMTNIGLDHIGQSEEWLKYAAELSDENIDADFLAYRRKEKEYRNVQLVEFPNEDFAYVVVRQFFMDVYNYLLYSKLTNSKDTTFAAIAQKSLKEVRYHLRHSSNWMVRLGDGTSESHERLQNAVNDLWFYTGDLFVMPESEQNLAKDGIIPDLAGLESDWNKMVMEVFNEAGMQKPEYEVLASGSFDGQHTEYMGFMLCEFQYLPNMLQDAKW
ncbi:MAG: phenylacetate-CoA oxygenase subunit PaaC [Crocinitomicaceae bacterium]|nr:phenylacetate-CoA oxygenase subunit PaaC [Crocinitomicaceae bacterium]